MTVSRQQLEELLKRQRKQCGLTGRKLQPSNVSLDHIWPLSRGGSATIENCQLVVREANAAKGSLTPDEFLKLCREVLAEDRRKRRRKTRAKTYRRRGAGPPAGMRSEPLGRAWSAALARLANGD